MDRTSNGAPIYAKPTDSVDVVADVHDLKFEDKAFANIVVVDVLHNFSQPSRALAECARVLRPTGRLVLVEPWAGVLSRRFYRYVHQEDCAELNDPWTKAFPAGKDPLDGNAAIPISTLCERASELETHAPGLRVDRVEPFGALSFLLTGGFQRLGLPAPAIRVLCRAESLLPPAILKGAALRALFVVEKTPA